MPRIAIISDVHGNLPALESVVSTLKSKSPDIWICLGDLVGYGPWPAEVIDFIKTMDMMCVKGNHDAGVTGELTDKHFKNPNRKLINLTKRILSDDQISWLKGRPYFIEHSNWVAAHASPIEPQKWRYLESAFTARDILNKIDQAFCFVGHTHKPALVSTGFGIIGSKGIQKGHSYLVNPGSVGQSRDGDYRASCALLDTDELTYENIRVDYKIDPIINKLVTLGFSRKEASRMMATEPQSY